MSDLNDILNGLDTPEAEEVETVEEVIEETTGDTEQPEQQEPEQEVSTPETEDKETPEEPWTKTAYLDEKRKRQELERQLQELKAREQEPAAKKDWFEDPEAAEQGLRSEFQQQLWATKVEVSQDMMRTIHEDYDELEAEFVETAKSNPALLAEFQRAANPAKFAYESAKKAREFKAMQDPSYKTKLEEQIRRETEEKLRKEYEEKLRKEQAKLGAIQPSLSRANTTGGLKSNDWSGPTPLEDILK